jgi:hypothetical protein
MKLPRRQFLHLAARAAALLAIVCAVGGGAETAIATTRSTTETA